MAGTLEPSIDRDPGPVRFTRPAGYQDLTNYQFASADGRRRLVVRRTDRLAGRAELQAAAEGYKFQIQELFARDPAADPAASGPGDVTTSPVRVRPDGTASVVVSFTLRSGRPDRAGPLLRERCGFVHFLDGSGAQLSYTAPADDEAAEAEFAVILDGAAPATPSATRSAPIPPGFVRRPAGGVEVDVPASLVPPDCYQFISPDKQVRLNLNVVSGDDEAARVHPAVAVPSGARRVAAPGYEDAGYEMYETTYEGSAGLVTRYDCRQTRPLKQGVRVVLTAQSPAASVDQMRQDFDTLAASVRDAD